MWTLNVTLKKNCHINHAKNMRDRKCFFFKLKQDPDPGFKQVLDPTKNGPDPQP